MPTGRSLLARDVRFTRDDAEFDRAIGFIDATYALALTLLVTTLDVANPAEAFEDPGSLFDAVGPQFIAFLIAFAVIANYWLEHHRMISAWGAIDVPRSPPTSCWCARSCCCPSALSPSATPTSRGWRCRP